MFYDLFWFTLKGHNNEDKIAHSSNIYMIHSMWLYKHDLSKRYKKDGNLCWKILYSEGQIRYSLYNLIVCFPNVLQFLFMLMSYQLMATSIIYGLFFVYIRKEKNDGKILSIFLEQLQILKIRMNIFLIIWWFSLRFSP